MAANPPKTKEDSNGKSGSSCVYVKVSMDGAPYLRKVDLKNYNSYKDLSVALENMFSCFTIGNSFVKPSLTCFTEYIFYCHR